MKTYKIQKINNSYRISVNGELIEDLEFSSEEIAELTVKLLKENDNN